MSLALWPLLGRLGLELAGDADADHQGDEAEEEDPCAQSGLDGEEGGDDDRAGGDEGQDEHVGRLPRRPVEKN